ncbi:MAG: pyrroline-5-carboxylate reductase, partial [Deltaproteobacteria bacterium]
MANQIKTIGIIGLGRMGRCMVKGLLETQTLKKTEVFFTTKHSDTASQVERDLGIKSCQSNLELVSKSDVVVIAVKPQNITEVLEEIGKKISKDQTLVSIVASIPTALMEKKLPKNVPVIRAMPNTPAFVGAGMTAWCAGSFVTESHFEKIQTLFKPLGKVARVDEKHLDAVTGLSGCGPAYIYVVLESLTDAGIKVGLPRELA